MKHLAESDEALDRKILSASSLTEIGSLYIGQYHVAYESANYLPSVGESHEYERILTPIAFIDKLDKYVHSKLLALTLTSGQVQCFLFKEEKLLDLAQQRIQSMMQSLKHKQMGSSSSGSGYSSGFFSKISSSSSISTSSQSSLNTISIENYNLYLSPLMKAMNIDPDSTDQRVLNNAILTQKVQEALLQQSTNNNILGNTKPTSTTTNTGIFGMFSSIGKNIFGSKKK